MEQFLLVILLLVAIAMVGLIMLQRSEGGALGIGGGGAGGLMSARGSANLLTRATAILAALFMCLSLALAAINSENTPSSIVDEIAADDATVPLAGDISETPVPQPSSSQPSNSQPSNAQGDQKTEPGAVSVPVAE